MNILLIGNGFDLAHSLPTGYSSFLAVCKATQEYPGRIRTYDSRIPLYEEFCKLLTDDEYKDFIKLTKNNAWIKHFQGRISFIGEKWIDFESEINSVITLIIQEMTNNPTESFHGNDCPNLARVIHSKYGARIGFKEAFDSIQKDLIELNQSLEIYFDAFVNRKTVEQHEQIINIDIDKLISFNYTSTYTENYLDGSKDDFDFCYIHGRADVRKGLSNCNLVLGFDDHYLEEGKAILEKVPFEKYYQRIVKGTDNRYLEWLHDINNDGKISHLYVYGHSLAPSDGDILRLLIDNQRVKTTIFYYNEEDRARKIANLAVVLGATRLIELAGGRNNRISFLPIID